MRALKTFLLALACAALAAGASAATTKHHAKRAKPVAMPAAAAEEPEPVKPGCKYDPIDIQRWGMKPFVNAPVVPLDANNTLNATLTLDYLTTHIASCEVHLRDYNGALVGPTWRVNPDTTIKVHLENKLPKTDPCPMHHSNTPGMGFNITNLHVHGLHVSPSGNSDNVFVQVCPPGSDKPSSFDYEFKLNNNGSKQPPGTNWYHSHLHGSTALQVSSGVEGAIIVEGGQDNLPAIKAIRDMGGEQVMVLQEIAYDEEGVIEDYSNFGNWANMDRAITINGQIAPVITMRPGEVQYWRMIAGGVTERMPLYISDADGNRQPLNEIATDGNALGHIDAWMSTPLELDPGYRSDVLFKAPPLPAGKTSMTYYLTTAPVPGLLRLEAQLPAPGDNNANELNKEISEVTPAKTILVVQVFGAPHEMALPTNDELKNFRFFENIYDKVSDPVVQKIEFASGSRICDPANPAKPCTPCTEGPNCTNRFMVNDIPYTDVPAATRKLRLGTISRWDISTYQDSGSAQHPFHIHVNPFEMQRLDPNGVLEWVWKDTILVNKTEHPPSKPLALYSHYEDFDGQFVLHCHILNHEDKGMMQNVEIVK
jgi:FtsP/CotA-like multicopper oxidase with cupredoxin domain